MTQGRIQTGNGSVQTLWRPKNVPKNEEEQNKVVVWLDSELPYVLFKRTSYTTKNEWLKVCKTI